MPTITINLPPGFVERALLNEESSPQLAKDEAEAQ